MKKKLLKFSRLSLYDHSDDVLKHRTENLSNEWTEITFNSAKELHSIEKDKLQGLETSILPKALRINNFT